MMFILTLISILKAVEPSPVVSWEQLLQEGRYEESYVVAKQQLSGSYTDFYLGLISQKSKKWDVSAKPGSPANAEIAGSWGPATARIVARTRRRG